MTSMFRQPCRCVAPMTGPRWGFTCGYCAGTLDPRATLSPAALFAIIPGRVTSLVPRTPATTEYWRKIDAANAREERARYNRENR